jgi:4-amino-4-deoxy-L-arabinose transferase-like glycosyltransferase
MDLEFCIFRIINYANSRRHPYKIPTGNVFPNMSLSLKNIFSHKTFLFILLGYVLFSFLLIDVFPPPLADDMFFAPAAKSLFETGRLQTSVVAGLEQATYWNPPGYYLLLGVFIKFFGYSLISIRAFSILFCSLIIFLTYLIGKEINLSGKYLAIVVILLAVDPFFLRYPKIGRMDSLCITLILLSLFGYLRWLHNKKNIWNWISALAGGLAVAVHPLGLIAPLGISVHRAIWKKERQWSWYSVAFPLFVLLIVIVLMSVYRLQDFQAFLTQIQFQFARKSGRGVFTSTLNWLARYRALLVLLAATVVTVIALPAKLSKRKMEIAHSLVAICSLLAFIAVVTSYELYYPAYYIPLIAISIGIFLRDMSKRDSLKRTLRFVHTGVVLVIVNCLLFDGYFAYLYLYKYRAETSIEQFSRSVGELIPENSKVLMIGSPCLYFQYYRDRHDLTMYTPPAIDSASERRLVENIDIVLVTRGFQAAYDSYVQTEMDYWNAAFAKSGKQLEPAGSIGKEIDYTYRGSVYKVIRLPK